MNLESVKKLIRDVPDFPSQGVIFKDITPVLSNAEAFKTIITKMADEVRLLKPSKLAGIDSRGFLFAAAIAQHLSMGIVLIRKKGKLPWKTVGQAYQLEYGTDEIEIHEDALSKGERVVVIDDVLATGGTALGAIQLCEKLDAHVTGFLTMIELEFLNGRKALSRYEVKSVFKF